MTQSSTDCNVINLGMIGYQLAWDLQHRLVNARAIDGIPDTLLLLEHPHTYTFGRSGEEDHLLLDGAARARLGIEVVDVDRGGDITYHGPGQLVAYPILYLGTPDASGRLIKADYVGYLRRLEETLIQTLQTFGLKGYQEPGYTGVWVDTVRGPEKIAAIGVRVSARGVTSHGVALNITTDLEFFDGIIPCGIADRPVTSMQALLGSECPPLMAVGKAFTSAFKSVFEYQRLTPVAAEAVLSFK